MKIQLLLDVIEDMHSLTNSPDAEKIDKNTDVYLGYVTDKIETTRKSCSDVFVSEEMAHEIRIAQKCKIPVGYFSDKGEEVKR